MGFLLATVVVVCVLLTSSSGVIGGLYGPDDFIIEVKPEDVEALIYNAERDLVVEFYSQYCGHCQHFAPVYKQLATSLALWQPLIGFAAIHCAEYQDLCARFKVNYYPFLRYVRRGATIDTVAETLPEYKGGARSIPHLVNFVAQNLEYDLKGMLDYDKSVIQQYQEEADNGEVKLLVLVHEKSDKETLAKQVLIESEIMEKGVSSVMNIRDTTALRANFDFEVDDDKKDWIVVLQSGKATKIYKDHLATLETVSEHFFSSFKDAPNKVKEKNAEVDVEDEKEDQVEDQVEDDIENQVEDKVEDGKVEDEAKDKIREENEQNFIYKEVEEEEHHEDQGEEKDSKLEGFPEAPLIQGLSDEIEKKNDPIRIVSDESLSQPNKGQQVKPKVNQKSFSLPSYKMVQMDDLLYALLYLLSIEIPALRTTLISTECNLLTDFIMLSSSVFGTDKNLAKGVMTVSQKLRQLCGGKNGAVKTKKLRQIWDNEQLPHNDVVALSDFKWKSCLGSDPRFRGFPCSLWILFHSLLANCQPKERQVTLATSESVDACGGGLVLFIKDFVQTFFGCQYCRDHFVAMVGKTPIATLKAYSQDESILYLWKSHNEVNQRLMNDITADPDHPKIQFPSKALCLNCRSVQKLHDETLANNWSWDEEVVLTFLKSYYNKNHMTKTQGAFLTSLLWKILFIVIFMFLAARLFRVLRIRPNFSHLFPRR